MVDQNLSDLVKSIEVNRMFHASLNGGEIPRRSWGGALLLTATGFEPNACEERRREDQQRSGKKPWMKQTWRKTAES